jgi:phosphatidylglycerophosphatase A
VLQRFPILLVAALGWPEIIGCLVIVLILFGAKKLPGLARGLGRGIEVFRVASKDVQSDLDRAAEDAGQSVAGIHGKPAYEALTQDNRVAEFYSIPKHDGAHSAPMKFGDKLIVFVAQGFGIGRIPFAPGTWGTLLGFGWCWLLLSFNSFEIFIFGSLMGVIAAVLFCGWTEDITGQKDPGSVVLDEIVAIPVCYVGPLIAMQLADSLGGPPAADAPTGSGAGYSFLTTSWKGVALAVTAFLLFRLFDIWKPWPVRQAQSLPSGWGVVIDDVLAAAYVNLVALALYAVAYFLR